MKFGKKRKELPNVEPVKIKPLFGLKPGLWLTIAYALAILAIIFAVCMLPDIISGSKRVTFTSDAGTAAVFIDGVYQGGTPFTRKVPSGTHNVTYSINGCELDSFTVKIGHPVFLNWLFPRTQSVHSFASITKNAYDELSKELLEDVNLYSAILEYDSVHRYPPLYSSYSTSLVSSEFKHQSKVFEAALMFATTSEMQDDADDAIAKLGINLFPMYKTLDGKSKVGVAVEEPALKAKKTSLDAGTFKVEGFAIPEADFSNGKEVTASYPEVMEAGVQVHTDAFNIGAYCVTELQYSLFVQANPMWAASNKENLVAQGLVDEYYLDGVTISTSVLGNRPVRNVSFNAAQAFCTWLSSVTGKNVYLPTENQWIAASFTDYEGGYQRSLAPSEAQDFPSAMLGSVWEITGTPFIPLARIHSQDMVSEVYALLDEYEVPVDMVIKGGSYANGFGTVDRYSVGTTYRSLCSDYMGFRIAWN